MLIEIFAVWIYDDLSYCLFLDVCRALTKKNSTDFTKKKQKTERRLAPARIKSSPWTMHVLFGKELRQGASWRVEVGLVVKHCYRASKKCFFFFFGGVNGRSLMVNIC